MRLQFTSDSFAFFYELQCLFLCPFDIFLLNNCNLLIISVMMTKLNGTNRNAYIAWSLKLILVSLLVFFMVIKIREVLLEDSLVDWRLLKVLFESSKPIWESFLFLALSISQRHLKRILNGHKASWGNDNELFFSSINYEEATFLKF